MDVPDTWVQAEEAVNRFDAFCISRKWPFIAAPANRDFGKDGYVDVSDGGHITGESFFVQVKGGRSYAAAGGYRIPVEGHLDLWRDSPAAVIGIVRDPGDDRLRWVNLTSALREDPNLPSVLVSEDAVLDDEFQVAQLRASVRATTVVHQSPIGIGSPATRDQAQAVWEAFALGHRDPAPLIAVRRAMFAFDRAAKIEAVYALSHCTPHPDIVWSKSNWLPPPLQNAVSASFRWSHHEVWQLLEVVEPENAMERGTIGQCVYMLLIEDPDLTSSLWRVVSTTDDQWVLAWGSAVLLNCAADRAPAELERLLEARADFASCPLGGVLIDHVRTYGWVSVM